MKFVRCQKALPATTTFISNVLGFSHSTFAASLWLAAPHIPRFEGETVGAWGRRVEGMTFVAISGKQEMLVSMFKNFLLLCSYVNCLGIKIGAGCGGDIVEQCKSLIHLRKAIEERGLIMPEQPPFQATSPACFFFCSQAATDLEDTGSP